MSLSFQAGIRCLQLRWGISVFSEFLGVDKYHRFPKKKKENPNAGKG